MSIARIECDLCIVGGGPAGFTAGIFAANSGKRVIMLEKRSKPGRKLLLTGGGHCNILHWHTPQEFLDKCKPYDRFLRHSIFSFSPEQTFNYFQENGLPLQKLASGRVLPVSEKASDVLELLVRLYKDAGGRIIPMRSVSNVSKRDGKFIAESGDIVVSSDKIIIATGGASYPETGSDGSMFEVCRGLGHSIVKPRASLVAVHTKESFGSVAGVSVEEARVGFKDGKKRYNFDGPVVFTDTGIGGPAVLNLSREILPLLEKGNVDIWFDLVPNIDEQAFKKVIDDSIAKNPRKLSPQIINDFMPRSLAVLLCSMVGCEDKIATNLTRSERNRICELVKNHPLTVIANRSLSHAAATRGGVCNKEIDPKTMESKIVPGLFFAGEVMDVDGPCGGYNLQIAWSTGKLAGQSV